MKKVSLILALMTILLGATTLSFAQTTNNELGGNDITSLSPIPPEKVSVLDTVDIGATIEVGKDIIDGNGFDWSNALATLVPLLIFGCGWINERWRSNKKDIVLAAVYEGSQFITAGTRYLATKSKTDFNATIKEAHDMVIVPKGLLKEQKE